MNELIIIKLGGSVITDKAKPKGSFRKNVVLRIAGEIKRAQNKKKFKLIIVHGAGSYGHPIAKKYNLNKGYSGLNSAVGVVKCRAAMADLKQLMVKTLNDCNVMSDIVDTSSVSMTEDGNI
jgi:isopentenyl phosphate kinase